MHPAAARVPENTPRWLSLATVVFVVAAAKLAIHLYAINGYGIFRDELYYLACGRRLQWGYVEFPPLIPAMIGALTAIFGDSLFVVRIMPAIAGAALVILTAMLAREMGGSAWAQALAALCVLSATIWLAIQHTLQPNAFDPLLWMGCAYMFIRWTKTRNPNSWLWFGLIAGIGLLSKHAMLFFGFALVIGLLLTRERAVLGDRKFWLGGLIAAVIFVPHMIWQVQNGWPQIEFLQNAERDKNVILSPWEFISGQILSLNPATFPVWICGLSFLLLSRAAKPWRALGICYLVILITLIVLHGKVYYLTPAYPMLFAAGGIFFERLRQRWIAVALAAIILVSGIAFAPLGLPLLSVEQYISYAAWLGVGEMQSERHEQGKLPQYFADMHGWEQLAAEVGRVFMSLSPEERAKTAVFAQNYGEAGAVEYFGRNWGDPRVISGHNTYWLWGPGDAPIETLIIIGGKPEEARQYFASVEHVATFRHDLAMPYQNNRAIWLCRGLKVNPREIWPRVKRYV